MKKLGFWGEAILIATGIVVAFSLMERPKKKNKQKEKVYFSSKSFQG